LIYLTSFRFHFFALYSTLNFEAKLFHLFWHRGRHQRRGFPFGYLVFGLLLMTFFGWKLFFIFPFLMIFAFKGSWGRSWQYDGHEPEIEKPKHKPKNDDYNKAEYI
jgi:hypothetical protein